MVTSEQVVEEAKTWIGTPWVHQGRNHRGIDCAGLPILVGKALGLSDYDITNYPRRPDGTFVQHFADHMDSVKLRDIRPGDVVIFNEGRDRAHPCHCGIVATKRGVMSVIHSHARRRQVIHERLEEAKSVVGRPGRAFRYRGLED